jgi:hypothetical protein
MNFLQYSSMATPVSDCISCAYLTSFHFFIFPINYMSYNGILILEQTFSYCFSLFVVHNCSMFLGEILNILQGVTI